MTDDPRSDDESLTALPARPLRVAVLYNLKENAPRLNGRRPADALAELDSVEYVREYVAALRPPAVEAGPATLEESNHE